MKDHQFLRSVDSDNEIPLCAFCDRPESEHASLVECDICHKPDFCTKFMSMMMCASCHQNEQKLQAASLAEASRRVEESILAMNRDNVTEVIRYNSEFYNAAVISLAQLRESILKDGGTEFDFAASVEARINHLQSAIIPGIKKSLEQASSELHISQKMLNDVVSQFRSEERAKFKSADINYTPQAPKAQSRKIKVPTIKSRDPMDALAAQYLAIMEKRGTPIKSVYEVYHDGRMLYKGRDSALANIKAKESGGIVKEITPFMVAKLRAENGFSDESDSSETIN